MFKLLKTFRAVYETKNFSQAAEQLYISQPAVSNQIKQLEEELALELFVRSGRQEIITTEQADLLYAHLLNWTDDWEYMLQVFRQKNEQKECCTIIASNTFAVYYLPELMIELVKKFPQVSFVLELGNSEEVLDKIEKHQGHFGFIEKPLITDKSTRKQLLTDELVHVGNFSHPMWLVREQDSGVYHYTQRYFSEKNLDPLKMTIKNNEMVIKCLEQGLGQSIVSKKAITEQMNWESLSDEYKRTMYLVKRYHLESVQLNKIEAAIVCYYQK